MILDAVPRVTTVAAFVPPDFPESIVVDQQDNIYVSIYATGEVRKIDRSGTPSTVAVLGSGPTAFPGRGLAGLALYAAGDIYVTLNDVPETHGVWGISRRGKASLFAHLPSDVGPNALAFDLRGRLYVSDSTGGRIFRIGREGRVTLWSGDPLLAGSTPSSCGTFPAGPLGANGIAFDPEGALVVAVTTTGAIVRIPVSPDGSAGAANYIAGPTCELWGADGTAFDRWGNLYVAVNIQRKIVRVDWRGQIETLVAYPDAPLNGPSAIAFGRDVGERRQIFISNFAPPALGGGTPGVVTMRVGIRGLPLP
jgi:sugar lactone lactonase YvrE